MMALLPSTGEKRLDQPRLDLGVAYPQPTFSKYVRGNEHGENEESTRVKNLSYYQ